MRDHIHTRFPIRVSTDRHFNRSEQRRRPVVLRLVSQRSQATQVLGEQHRDAPVVGLEAPS